MESFEYAASPVRIVFGPGAIRKIPVEAARLGMEAPLLLCTSSQLANAEAVKKLLDNHVADIFAGARMHTPRDVTLKVLGIAADARADGVISIGGGSAVGLGKAITVEMGLKHICVPTTYSGSEVTSVLGETKDGVKTTRSDPKILPSTVIYDPELTVSLPPGLTATSGVNAIAHSVEALYAKEVNQVLSLLAMEGIKALATSLPVLMSSPSDIQARSSALYGAWLCGTSLASVGIALHHKICHTLGGSMNLPHSETHTIMLPHSLSYNAPAVPDAMKRIAAALPGSDGDAIKGLNELLRKLKVKTALKDFGMKEEDITKAAAIAVEKPYWNPRIIEQEKIQELIRRAWAGEEARADL